MSKISSAGHKILSKLTKHQFACGFSRPEQCNMVHFSLLYKKRTDGGGQKSCKLILILIGVFLCKVLIYFKLAVMYDL